MKEVIFKHISIKNFLSIGDEPIDFDVTPGIHIITGINKDKEDSKNGVGKSAIADAIFFVIFGTTLRPIKKEVITNWINKKECSVTCTFNVIDDGQVNEYTLLRALNPSRVQLIKNGEDISRTIGKTNENIYDILGTTPEMFEQSVIMCLNEVEPFLAKTPAVKRKFIEDIFKIEIFGKMSQFIKNEYNEIKHLLDSEIEKNEDLQSNIQLYQKQQQERDEKKKTRIQELENRKKNTNDEIEGTKQKILEIQNKINASHDENKEELKKNIDLLKEKQKKISDFDKQNIKILSVNEATVINIKNSIVELEKLSDGICVYCKQPFSESNKQEKKKMIEKHRQDMNECLDIIKTTEEKNKQLQKIKNELEDLLDDYTKKIRNIENYENQFTSLNNDLKRQEIWLSQINKDIENIKNETDSTQDIIKEFNIRSETLQKTINEYKNKLSLIESSKFIVSDEGVKSFIIKKMLKMLNGRLNYYLKRFDANGTCVFNEYFEETMTNNRGRDCSYFSFSSGERKRFDLSMLYTFKDIRRMQSNIAVNIGLYDELLDTALDTKGIEAAMDILKERVINNKEAIYIISHKNEAIKHATGEIIYLEKENDITKRKFL